MDVETGPAPTDSPIASVSPRLQARIDAMFMRDRIAATVLIVALWLIVLFVMLAVRPFFPAGPVEIVCWVSAAILLVFNSASILAMIRHYSEDRAHIYGTDIRHLDAGR